MDTDKSDGDEAHATFRSLGLRNSYPSRVFVLIRNHSIQPRMDTNEHQ